MLKRESVLKDQGIQVYNDIEFEELSHIPKINLRGQSDNKDFMSSSGTILDILLPTEPNISNVTVNAKVIWLGPNEWLVEINNENKFKEILIVSNSDKNFFKKNNIFLTKDIIDGYLGPLVGVLSAMDWIQKNKK